jgi:membrane protease YdiL (CAAX protease family)
VSDDLTGPPGESFQLHPELPVVGPAQPSPPAVPRAGSAAWPWYFAVVTFFGGLAAVIVLAALATLVFTAFGADVKDNPTFNLVATALQDIGFVATAWIVADRMGGGARLSDFGLVRAPFGPTVKKIAIVGGTYVALLIAYNALVSLPSDEGTPTELGANKGALAMFAFAVLVAVVAPFAEEFFFRGMIFRSIANGIGVVPGAIVSGVLFGALHISETTTGRLLQVGALMVLGIFFALLYAWSGTLFATIALHATNNSLAVVGYAHEQNSDFGMIIAGVLWVGMMIFCTLGYRLTDRPDKGPGAGPVEYALPR